jgi:cytochrome c biogenesis protein CcdA
MFSFPLLLTIYAGFIHAFEADHLLAVSNIVSQRNNIRLSLRDGIFWGLGHTSTIFIVGTLMIVFKAGISPTYFRYLEGLVGCMLIALAIHRLLRLRHRTRHETHRHSHHNVNTGTHSHSLAYSVGLVHGLAGSGALLLIVMAEMKGPIDGLLYLAIFGLGCIGGMFLAAGLFGIPFSKRLVRAPALQTGLILLSSLLCLLYGGKVIWENLPHSWS